MYVYKNTPQEKQKTGKNYPSDRLFLFQPIPLHQEHVTVPPCRRNYRVPLRHEALAPSRRIYISSMGGVCL